MLTLCRPRSEAFDSLSNLTWLLLITLAYCAVVAHGMTRAEIAALK